MSFDVDTKEFRLSFRDDEARRPPDPTEIFIPTARHYPSGFTVEVTQGDRWDLDESGTRILLFRGRSEVHEVRIGAVPTEGNR
jgi:hypothetical protein